ncbi:helix-turn-helix domain-containing protein [Jeotgalibacillus campisalis]|uniref:HTH cro/C1-type domain-containing protein n=1 Tax=Jeotgalibacillus campisalis TaxID=220754 RepID=A0A0C2V1W0_9BACL|nr:helix-turn-helix transcriptional regulator [Jeotgalibacillus campisalis]KIL43022.1 hypothetical protein KR50_34250 [Jeotgalibacillus campisalis]
MNVGSIIKYYRTKKGLTQTDLADGICSTSHLSKIETNMYTANEETLNMLLQRLDLRLEDEKNRMGEIEDLLQEFIESLFAYDDEQIDHLYIQISEIKDYIETSEYVNLYHIYMYRYYVWSELPEKEKEILTILQRIKTTFTPAEQNLYLFIQALNLSFSSDYKASIKLFKKFLDNPLPVGKFWTAEAYYQLALSYSHINQHEASVIYAKKASEIFETESNWKRLIHTQMILGICFMELRLFTEAGALYKPLVRNSRIFFRDSVYPHILSNYARCLLTSKEYSKARKLMEEALVLLGKGSEQYMVVLLNWLESGLKIDLLTEEWERNLNDFHDYSLNLDNKYYFYYAVYLKKMQFSQVDGIKYAIKWLYPYLIKHSFYQEAEELLPGIIDYYSEKEDHEKVIHYYDQWRELVKKERSYNEEGL